MSPSQKMKKLVVVDDGISTIKVDGLEPYARTLADEFVIHRDSPADNEALIQRCQDADAVINILSTSEFTRDLMTRCPDLRVVSIWAAGVNNVDLDAAKELGVTICNTPGYGNFGVGEHTLALMLAAARNMNQVDRRIRQGEWVKEPLIQLYGKTLGVLGAGPIAQRVMELGRLIGMDVIAWTLNPSPERAAKYGVEFVDVDTLCQKADVVAAIIALSDKTHHVIGRKQLEMMKPSAIVVNTGRGALIDEDALYEFLRDGKIKAAGLDVFSTEPLPAKHPFTELDNVVLSSHVAAHTPETTLAGVKMSLDNIATFIEGNTQNVFSPGFR